MDISGKIICPPFAIIGLIYAGRRDAVREACEVDVISMALLLARWRRLTDGRAEVDAVEDRTLRRVIELRDGRAYIAALDARRQHPFVSQCAQAANDAATLAPWLGQDAALPIRGTDEARRRCLIALPSIRKTYAVAV